jgi:hypothetical protein
MEYLRMKPTKWRWEDDGERRFISFVSRKRMGIQLLNPVASMIYANCDGKHTEEEVVEMLQGKFPKVPVERLQSDVNQFVSFLKQADLVEVCESSELRLVPGRVEACPAV